MVANTFQIGEGPALCFQPWQLGVIQFGHIHGGRRLQAQLHLDVGVADVLVFVGHLDEALTSEAPQGVEGVCAIGEDSGIDSWSHNGGCEASHGLQRQTRGSGWATCLVTAITAIIDSIAPTQDACARAISALELDIGDERHLTLLRAENCWGSPVRVAADFIGPIVTIGNTVAPSISLHALITGQALERVPVHLASVQMRLVRLTDCETSVLGIYDQVLGLAWDASFRRSTSGPPVC
jgi:hypothetical protein